MKVLLTGAFGNVGSSALDELLERGHQVRCFDVKTRENVKAARKIKGKAEVFWGDLRHPEDVNAAVEEVDRFGSERHDLSRPKTRESGEPR